MEVVGEVLSSSFGLFERPRVVDSGACQTSLGSLSGDGKRPFKLADDNVHRIVCVPPRLHNINEQGTKKYGDEEDLCDIARLRLVSSPAIDKDGQNSMEDVWRQFFAAPGEWWDHTTYKVNPKYPDFKHKHTGVGLWINGRRNPPWVKTKLASMVPGSVSKSLYTWNSMISECVKCDHGQRALDLYNQMAAEGLKPDAFTFTRVLNACASLIALEVGRRVHLHVIESGLESNVCVASTLVDMYAKCGSIEDAWSVFQGMTSRTVVSWTAMLGGYVKRNEGRKALDLFGRMLAEGLKPNPVTFVAVLNACASILSLDEGMRVHAQVIESGLESDVYVGSTLVGMYAKCGNIEDAARVFRRMPTHNVVSWNSMLAGYVKCEEGQKALELFRKMQRAGVKPNPVTFIIILNACTSMVALDEGKYIHSLVIVSNLESDVGVSSTLVDMFCKCGSLEDARTVFDRMPSRNVVSWSSMLAGYVKCEKGQEALTLFRQMQAEGVRPNPVTFVAVLNACASLVALEEGRRIHAQVIESGIEDNIFVGSTLVDMYGKCGSIEDAWRVFHGMPNRNVVSWSAMIAAYVKCDNGQMALDLFAQMQKEGVKPNSVTFVVVLNACASMMALEEGRRVHSKIVRSGFESDVVVSTTLVDMYSKCGSVQDAWRVFDRMPSRSVVSWNAMLGGFAMHGQGRKALELFEQMCQEGLEVSMITFVCLLSACSQGGLVEEGIQYFESMDTVYGISPTVEHYVCMIDLLGRAGRLEEAEGLLERQPEISKDSVALMALLGACRNHRNVKMGERIAQQVLELEPDKAAGYVLLSGIYAAAGQWDDRDIVEKIFKERGVKKQLGRTWIELNGHVHSFVVDDRSHAQIVEIHAELQRLSVLMKEEGYVPDTRFAIHNVEQNEKALRLWHHSEKLAIAFGLINTAPGTPLCIYKNLRVCVDCHTATKFMSKIERRTIVVRDANRFHHFKDGQCSCKDYW